MAGRRCAGTHKTFDEALGSVARRASSSSSRGVECTFGSIREAERRRHSASHERSIEGFLRGGYGAPVEGNCNAKWHGLTS